jgi:hypothetical protein
MPNTTIPELKHFESTQAVIKTALEEYLENLREDHAAAIGSHGEHVSDQQLAAIEDRMRDLEKVLSRLNAPGPRAKPH